MTPSLAPRVFLIEDDENDVFIMKRAMTKANLNLPINIATNGREAIEYLSGAGQYADRTAHPLPQYIFLDLKLPYVHGFEVLDWIGKQPALRDTCVFVLTSSPEERDHEKAERLGAKAYLVKPPTPQMLLAIFKPEPEGQGGADK